MRDVLLKKGTSSYPIGWPIPWTTRFLSLLLFLLRNNTTLGIFTMQHKYTISSFPKSLVIVIIYNYWSPSPTVYCMKKDRQSFLHLCSGTPSEWQKAPWVTHTGPAKEKGTSKATQASNETRGYRQKREKHERKWWENIVHSNGIQDFSLFLISV